MRFFLAAAGKDLRRLRRDPMALVLSAAVPLVVALLLKIAFGGDAPPTATLLVADHDDSLVSGLLVGSFSQGPLADMVLTETVTESEGRKRLDKGDGTALLVIPAGFGNAVLENTPTALVLVKNPAESILPLILEESLGLVVDAAFYLQILFGDTIAPLIDGPEEGLATFPDQDLIAVTESINGAMGNISGVLFPPVIQVTIDATDTSATAGMNFGALFLPGFLIMAVLFGAQGMSTDIWQEVESGALKRVLTTPARVSEFLLGKTAAGFLFAGVLGVVGLIAAQLIFGVHVHGFAVAALWAAATGAVLFLLFLTVQLFSKTARGGNILTGAVVFPLAMAGGSFFPFEAMPDWLAAAGRLTPNGWALEVFKTVLRGEADPAVLLRNTAALLGVGFVLFLVSHRRLVGGFARS